MQTFVAINLTSEIYLLHLRKMVEKCQSLPRIHSMFWLSIRSYPTAIFSFPLREFLRLCSTATPRSISFSFLVSSILYLTRALIGRCCCLLLWLGLFGCPIFASCSCNCFTLAFKAITSSESPIPTTDEPRVAHLIHEMDSTL